MSSSLLYLPDEALRHIFLSLGSDTPSDRLFIGSRALSVRRRAYRNLAACNRRLNTIYRNTVTRLTLTKRYTASDCARLWERFPRIAELRFNLSDVPGFMDVDFTSAADPGPWCGTPQAYPTGLVRDGVKAIVLGHGPGVASIHVRELQAMMENCCGLETLSFKNVGVHLDRESAEYTDDACSFSLERHARTLWKLEFIQGSLRSLPANDLANRDVDLRWLKLPSLSALRHLALSGLRPAGGSFSQLAALANLDTLSLRNMFVEDEWLKAVLPSLPQLRTVMLVSCPLLTSAVLLSLPLDLDLLDVSGSGILASGSSRYSCRARMGTVKALVAEDIPYREQEGDASSCMLFEPFLSLFSGASISQLDLNADHHPSRDLPHLLSSTPNLLTLRLAPSQYEFAHRRTDIAVYSAISQLSRLRNLDMDIPTMAQISIDGLVSLASGPSRHSLRRIRLSFENSVGDIVAANLRRIVSKRFDECVIDISATFP